MESILEHFTLCILYFFEMIISYLQYAAGSKVACASGTVFYAFAFVITVL